LGSAITPKSVDGGQRGRREGREAEKKGMARKTALNKFSV